MFKLDKVYFNENLSSNDYNKIIALHTKVSFKRGEIIIRENEVSNNYLCMEKGIARAFATNTKGEEITTEFYTDNEIVIELSSLFLKIPSKETIIAESDCICWKINYDDFQMLFHEIKAFREWGRNWLTSMLFKEKSRSISMIVDSATDRYLKLLNEKPEIILNVAMKHVASYLGITNTSFSRIRKEIMMN